MSSDITIIAPNGRQLLCHRAVLASRSKRLEAVFSSGEYTGQHLPVSGVDSAALEAVVSSFYSGECPVSIDTVCAVHDAASKLEVPDLLQSCLSYVHQAMSTDNVSSLLAQAQQLKDLQIIELCRNFLLAPGRFAELASTHDFHKQPFEVAASILLDANTSAVIPIVTTLHVAAAWLSRQPARDTLKLPLLQAISAPPGSVPMLEDIMQRLSMMHSAPALTLGGLGGDPLLMAGTPGGGRLSVGNLVMSSNMNPRESMNGARLLQGPGGGMSLGTLGLAGGLESPLGMLGGLPHSQMMQQVIISSADGQQQLYASVPAAAALGGDGSLYGSQVPNQGLGDAQLIQMVNGQPMVVQQQQPGGGLRRQSKLGGGGGGGSPAHAVGEEGGSGTAPGGPQATPQGQPRPSWFGGDGVMALAEAAEEAEKKPPTDSSSAAAADGGAVTAAGDEGGGLKRKAPGSVGDGDGGDDDTGTPDQAKRVRSVVGTPGGTAVAGTLLQQSPQQQQAPALPSTVATDAAQLTSLLNSLQQQVAGGGGGDGTYPQGATGLASGWGGLAQGLGMVGGSDPVSVQQLSGGLMQGLTAGGAGLGGLMGAAGGAFGGLSGLLAEGMGTLGGVSATEKALQQLQSMAMQITHQGTGMAPAAAAAPPTAATTAGGERGGSGRGKGSRSSNTAIKGFCHVENCGADLTGLRDYHQRYKICDTHLKAPSIMRDGVPQRFCQQCGRFHLLDQFDGTRRSCRAMLQRHNARRNKRNPDALPLPVQDGPRGALYAQQQQLQQQYSAQQQVGGGVAAAAAQQLQQLLSGAATAGGSSSSSLGAVDANGQLLAAVAGQLQQPQGGGFGGRVGTVNMANGLAP